MKSSLRVLLTVATVSLSSWTFADAPATPTTKPVNTAILPALRPSFESKHRANVEIAKKGDIDLLFMGDSITDFWRNSETPRSAASRAATMPVHVEGVLLGKPVFDKYFGQWKVANFGISGDTTQGVLYRLQNGEGQGFSPKAVMLMIGTNNTGKNSVEEIADGVKADVEELRKDFPEAKILLLGIFPRNGPAENRAKIPQINQIISKLDDRQHVFYLDIGDKFLGPDGNIPPEIMHDGLHPTTKGYEIWAQAVIEPLTRMMKGETP